MARDDDFDEFCRREYPRLVGALSLYCGDVSVAEEFAQEALARSYAQWGRVSTLDAPSAWTYRVAVNAANSWFRRRGAERRARVRHGDPASLQSASADTAEAVTIRQAVAGLPERQRTVITLRFFYDLSVAATAALLDTTEGAVKQHTARAMASLRNRFHLDVPAGDNRE